jgi:chromosome partition protein MukB
MNLPFFSPDPVWARELLLVGYQLFPCSLIPLHGRLTVLSGNNGVGKTTLLDAIQTVILCHQQYISMNVASGQNDRSIIGQLRQRVAWAAIGIAGHEEVTAMGVRLAVRPSGEQLDLSPFVLRGVQLQERLFLDPETSSITPDFQVLSRRILQADPTADYLPFERVDDYHSFLHEQGILPIPLMRPGKKKSFAGLWRQITQPRLTDLQAFLQDMLCPPPARKMNFSDVEKLMHDRRSVEERLKRLVRFRETRLKLEELRLALDAARRESLSADLVVSSGRVRSLRQQESRLRAEQEKAQQELAAQQTALTLLEEQESGISAQRDLLQKQQSSLDAQLRRHKEYVAAGRELAEADKRLQTILTEQTGIIEKCRVVSEEVASGNARWRELLVLRERIAGQETQLVKDVKAWRSFEAELVRAAEILGRKVASAFDVIEAWNEWDGPFQELRLLPAWKEQLTELQRRAKRHNEALALWKGLVASGAVTDPPRREDVEAGLRAAREDVIRLSLEEEKLVSERGRIQQLRDTLAQGRPPLPPEAQRMVDQGLADPVAMDFDQLDVQEAAAWQTRLGPFALAIRPRKGAGILDKLEGADRVFVVTSEAGEEEWANRAAAVGGRGALAWYEPQGPVWLSSRARAEQLITLARELEECDAAMARLKAAVSSRRALEERLAAVLGAWDALCDRESIGLEEALANRVRVVSEGQARTRACHDCVEKLKSRIQTFDLAESPAQLDAVRARIAEIERDVTALEEGLAKLRTSEEGLQRRQSELERERRESENSRTRAQSLRETLEKDEPLDVLEGRVDFTKAEQMARRMEELKTELASIKGKLRAGAEQLGKLRADVQNRSAGLNDMSGKLRHAAQEMEQATARWGRYYPTEDPAALHGDWTESGRDKARQAWAEARVALSGQLELVCREYGQELAMPRDREPDQLVGDVLTMLLPPDVELDREEEKLKALREELSKIEGKLRGYVEAIRNNVDADIRALTRKLQRINDILSNLGFGKVRKVYLEKVHEPAYEGLKHLRGTGQLSLFSSGTAVGLREFLDQIREIIARHAKGAQLEDDQITDYRTYVRLRWAIEDDAGRERRSGFSSGEGLGINLAICLSLLFYEGSDSGQHRGSGILLMALDEAERLDERAMNTVRDLLDRVECQLVLALPRVLNIPDSLTHILTALPQGVTHVGVYVPQASGVVSSGSEDVGPAGEIA